MSIFLKKDRYGDPVLWKGTVVLAATVAVIVLIAVFGAVTVIPSGHTGVVVHMGKVSDTVLQEGAHFKVPFVTRIKKVDNRVCRTDVESESASKDLQTVSAAIALNYRVDKQSSAAVFRNIGENYEEIIVRPAVQEAVKSVTAQYTAEELITRRQEVGEKMRMLLAEKIEPFGLRAEVFNIISFNFSAEFDKAIEAKQTAQQDALKAEQDLARIKVEAEQQVTQARAEAEAYRVKSQEITDAMIRMEAVKKWDGKLPNYYGGEQGNIFNIPIQ